MRAILTAARAVQSNSSGMVIAGGILTGLGVIGVGITYVLFGAGDGGGKGDLMLVGGSLFIAPISSLLAAGVPLSMVGAANNDANNNALIGGGTALTTVGVLALVNGPWLVRSGLYDESRHDAGDGRPTDPKLIGGVVSLAGGAAMMAGGIALFAVGNAPGQPAADSSGAALVPAVGVGPTSASLTWTF